MALDEVINNLRGDQKFMANVMSWQTLPARPAQLVDWPPTLHAGLQAVLRQRGIPQLYRHQAQAVDLALAGEHLVVVTPTASGKTLCYNLPILHTLLRDPAARALYLFPTKALAQDQLDELQSWLADLAQPEASAGHSLWAATYDGDTPADQRSTIRSRAQLILSNPDMLHSGMLPYHTQWAEFLAGLRYVVLDELHTYRGVFGSQVANVLRRLRRLCTFYGSRPQFVCASATIANPQQLAERLVEQPVRLINENGAPSGEKHIILYNPPLYDEARGLRRSSILESQELAARCIEGDVQTIVFGRSRLTTELLLTYLRERMPAPVQAAIRGYRGGYLPNERRAIESGLRAGLVRGVVATNALELGIDIGQLQAAVLCGYPGNLASTWQQMGRAGRTREGALALLVATGGALDQYIIRHPEFLFERSPEHALINPDNLMLLVDQIRCAAFELPFQADERFGASPFTADVLALLVEQGELRQHGTRFFWQGEGYPARQINLRNASRETVAIQVQDATGERNAVRIIGSVDQGSAPALVHAGAIYLHDGQSYRVDSLDLAHQLAVVTPVQADYYTESIADTKIDVLAEHDQRTLAGAQVCHGDLQVTSQVLAFRRVKWFPHETLGTQALDFPPQTTETSGYWFRISAEAQAALERAGQWYDSLNDYGPNWEEQRQKVRVRDQYRCTQCGTRESPGRQHDVHHLMPFRTFGYVRGLNENYRQANRLDNLVLVCRACHRRLEAGVRVRSGLDGLAYALGNLAPLHLMCDAQDIAVSVVRGETNDLAAQPQATLYIYERMTAGLGFSQRLYELHEELLVAAHDLVTHCTCDAGCPACVGPVLEGGPVQLPTKRLTLALLTVLMGGSPAAVEPGEAEAADVTFW